MDISEYFAGLDYLIQLMTLAEEMPWISLFDDEGDLTDSENEDKTDTVPFNPLINNNSVYNDSTFYEYKAERADYYNYTADRNALYKYTADTALGGNMQVRRNEIYGGGMNYLCMSATDYFEKNVDFFGVNRNIYSGCLNYAEASNYGSDSNVYRLPVVSYAEYIGSVLSPVYSAGGEGLYNNSYVMEGGILNNEKSGVNVFYRYAGNNTAGNYEYLALNSIFSGYVDLNRQYFEGGFFVGGSAYNNLYNAVENLSFAACEGGLLDSSQIFNNFAKESRLLNLSAYVDKYNKMCSKLSAITDNVDNVLNAENAYNMPISVSSKLISGVSEQRQYGGININVDFKAYADIKSNKDIERFAQVFVKRLEEELTDLNCAEGIHF